MFGTINPHEREARYDVVLRRETKRDFPLIEEFYYTGEELNGWRCETCVTKKQREAAEQVAGEATTNERPRNCRKCGLTF
jgi:hypothetical protein